MLGKWCSTRNTGERGEKMKSGGEKMVFYGKTGEWWGKWGLWEKQVSVGEKTSECQEIVFYGKNPCECWGKNPSEYWEKNGALWKKEVRIEKEFVIYGKNK